MSYNIISDEEGERKQCVGCKYNYYVKNLKQTMVGEHLKFLKTLIEESKVR